MDTAERYQKLLYKVASGEVTDPKTVRKIVRGIYLTGGPPPLETFLETSRPSNPLSTYAFSILMSMIPKNKRRKLLPDGSGMTYDDYFKGYLLRPQSTLPRVMKEWTDQFSFEKVQRLKRHREQANKYTNTLSSRIHQTFTQTPTRAPTIPRGMPPITYLYRGIKNRTFELMADSGILQDDGYIATSRSFGIAKRFARGRGKVLRLHVHDIPKGTPWIWFDCLENIYGKTINHTSMQKRRNGVFHSKACEEEEVLFPPGAMIAKNKSDMQDDVFDVTYIPNPK